MDCKTWNLEMILGYQERQYRCKEFQQAISKYWTKHVFSTLYNPTGNEIDQRINRPIILVLSYFQNLPLPRVVMLAGIRL